MFLCQRLFSYAGYSWGVFASLDAILLHGSADPMYLMLVFGAGQSLMRQLSFFSTFLGSALLSSHFIPSYDVR